MNNPYDKETYKVYSWKNWMILHFILNPGLALNELVLGQRIPKVTLEDKTSDKPRAERSYVPCPHCDTLHDGRIWSTENGTAFKNWFGLYCPNCGEIIPCVRNITSFLILAVTFPIWGWFKDKLKQKWLNKQPERYQEIELPTSHEYDESKWAITGMVWAGIMIIIMIPLYYFWGYDMSLADIITYIIIWIIGGLLFGYFMKLFMGRKGSNSAIQGE